MLDSHTKIMVVDDDTALLLSITDILEDEGYEVSGKEDGLEAIWAVSTEKITLVFMDVQMPGIDGIEAFRQIKEVSPDTSVIMMTGLPADDIIKQAIDETSYTVLYKPVQTRQVLLIAQAALGSPLVLVVDNEPDNRELLRMVFKDSGIRYAEAHDGGQAVSKIRDKSSDVVMMDIDTPGTSVFGSCQEILGIAPNAKIVFITGYDLGQSARNAVSTGAFSLLAKPVEPDHMLTLVCSLAGDPRLAPMEPDHSLDSGN